MENFIHDLSLVLGVTAVLSFFAVLLKQPITIAYILCGIFIGPWGLGWIQDVDFIDNISHLGVTLLLFLAGLNLQPKKLIQLFKKTTLVTFASCAISFLMVFVIALIFQFNLMDSLIIGLASIFSSTILAIKLLPTTDLHHKRMGAFCIGILIIQDLLAIAVLAFIRCLDAPQGVFISFSALTLKLIFFIGLLAIFEQFILRRVMRHVERLQEVLFVLGLAWCFGIASISNSMGLFYETGAFFAGVFLARHPISLFIAVRLKPIRDFFLVLFFFTLGAKLDLLVMKGIFIQALLLSGLAIVCKPWIFRIFFVMAGERLKFSNEAGVRLGQLSEFSLLVALLAFELGHISNTASQLIQLVTIFSFIASSYIVVYKYPTPIGTTESLNKN